MAKKRYFDRNSQPTTERIRNQIDDAVLPVWEAVVNHLAVAFPGCQSEMIYFSQQEGWGIRYRQESTLLCTLFPERGAFTTLITLTPQEQMEALEKSNYFNARIRKILNQSSSLSEGRWLWIKTEDHTDFVGIKLLLEFKKK